MLQHQVATSAYKGNNDVLPAPPSGVVGAVGSAASRSSSHATDLNEIAARIDKFANELVGAIPESATACGPTNSSSYSCALNHLDGAQNSVEMAIATIRKSLARIGA